MVLKHEIRLVFPTVIGVALLSGCSTQAQKNAVPEPVVSAPTAAAIQRVPVLQEAPEVSEPPPMSPEQPPEPTRILDAAAADRLMNNSGATLQWISWDYRGQAIVTEDTRGVWIIEAGQTARGETIGTMSVSGRIAEIGADYFILDGKVTITDSPDMGRTCVKEGTARFAVTQGRKYWRMREFEWCDGLTDYIDIYF